MVFMTQHQKSLDDLGGVRVLLSEGYNLPKVVFVLALQQQTFCLVT